MPGVSEEAMTAEVLLARLDGVRQTGHGRHLAKCPAHEDGSPSLSIRELDDGRTLVHCFGGCAAADVIAAVGLEFADLFPPRAPDPFGVPFSRQHRPTFDALGAMHALAHEAAVVATIAADIPVAGPLTTRLMLAAGRIHRALDAIGEPRDVPELKRVRSAEVAA
jgi:hypothetical protein